MESSCPQAQEELSVLATRVARAALRLRRALLFVKGSTCFTCRHEVRGAASDQEVNSLFLDSEEDCKSLFSAKEHLLNNKYVQIKTFI